MLLSITEEHIRAGIRNTGNNCPAAIALFEQTGNVYTVLPSGVHMGTSIEHSRAQKVCNTPQQLLDFIVAFDQRGADEVSPQTIELDLDQQERRQDASEDYESAY